MKSVNWLLLTKSADGKPLALKGDATCYNVSNLCKSVCMDELIQQQNIEVLAGQLTIYIASKAEFDNSFDQNDLLILNKTPIDLTEELIEMYYILRGPSKSKSG